MAALTLLRPVPAAAYRSFARNRYRISRWLGIGNAGGACDGDSCGITLGDRHGT